MTHLPHEPMGSLTGIEMFSEIPDDALVYLNSQCRWHRLPANELLIDGEGRKPHGIFVLTEGEVEVYCRNLSGNIVSIGKLAATTCFGEFAAITSSPGRVSVRTWTACRLAEIPRETFVSLLNAYPSISLYLLKKAIALVRTFNEDLIKLRMADDVLATVHRNAILRSL
ncbi:MAG: Crp/Fnr family transcriptional regulator [Pseudomonadota bacterium]